MSDVRITRVQFQNFKAFETFSLTLQDMNVLVGPNNSGKSTILNAFRVLSAGLRRAYARKPSVVRVDGRDLWGHLVPTDDIPMSFENVHNNYDTSRPSTITFRYSNKNSLNLRFLPDGRCVMVAEPDTGSARSPSTFKKQYPVRVDFVPVLGPLEHEEQIVEKATVARNLATHRASRNFRNFWRHFPEDFEIFAELLRSTWPDMEINRPEMAGMNTVVMFAEESRITRELYWSGFGFQIWCQLLTHIVRARDSDLLVVDEPEIYLHPDLQRRLLSLLEQIKPDVLLATHSTEILSEAEPQQIVLIDKTRGSGRRLRDIDQVQLAVEVLGSGQNITLTKLARTRRVLFVEGTDFKLLSRFGRILGLESVANQSDFTVVTIEGFSNWHKLKEIEWVFEQTLGESLVLGAVFDRDYFCDEEIEAIRSQLKRSLRFVHFHRRKELENYLLLPNVLDRAVNRKAKAYARERQLEFVQPRPVGEILEEITDGYRVDAQSQYIENRVRHLRSTGLHSATITSEAIRIFDTKWRKLDTRLEIVPGKQVYRDLKRQVQNDYGFSLSDALVLSACKAEEIPRDLVLMLRQIDVVFARATPEQ